MRITQVRLLFRLSLQKTAYTSRVAQYWPRLRFRFRLRFILKLKFRQPLSWTVQTLKKIHRRKRKIFVSILTHVTSYFFPIINSSPAKLVTSSRAVSSIEISGSHLKKYEGLYLTVEITVPKFQTCTNKEEYVLLHETIVLTQSSALRHFKTLFTIL